MWTSGSGARYTLGADLRNGLLVESLAGPIMNSFPILVHLLVLGHVVVGLQWPWNSVRVATNSQPSITGKPAYGRFASKPILTLHGCPTDIAEVLPAEIDAVIQNMGQRATHNHFAQHNRTCHLVFRNTRVV